MKDDHCISNKSQIAQEILAYLADHSEAQDTLEGIIAWWLLERKIKYQKSLVQEALRELVDKGLILETQAGASQCRYRLRLQKKKEL